MKKEFLYIVLLFVCFDFCKAQTVYPLSRNDSASIVEYNKKFNLEINQGHKKEASRYLNTCAMLYWDKNHFKEAEQYFLKSLKINEELANENGVAMLYNNLAMICADMKDYERSLEYFNKTLIARRVNKEKIGVISALINQSVVYNKLEKYNESVANLKEALDIAREMNDPNQMKICQKY